MMTKAALIAANDAEPPASKTIQGIANIKLPLVSRAQKCPRITFLA
jgi:hypothetical protein